MGSAHELLDHGFDEMGFSGKVDVVDSVVCTGSAGA